MADSIEAPTVDALLRLGLRAEAGDEPWRVRVFVPLRSGENLILTWDAIARSVLIRWNSGANTQLQIEREWVRRISVFGGPADWTFQIETRSHDTRGTLVLAIDEDVSVRDVLLET